MRATLEVLHIKDELLHRAVNEGFSGGEKKRNEIFQLAVLEPRLAILDERRQLDGRFLARPSTRLLDSVGAQVVAHRVARQARRERDLPH